MDCIHSKLSQIYNAGDGIHIRSIHVNKATGMVHFLGNQGEVLFKNAGSVGIGDHDTTKVLAMLFYLCPKVLQINHSLFIGL